MDPFAREASDRTSVKTSFVAFPVTAEGRLWHTAGELRLEWRRSRVPFMNPFLAC